MTSYRLYCYDGAGRLWVDDGLEAEFDEEALRAVGDRDTGIKCEVWDGHRLVETVER